MAHMSSIKKLSEHTTDSGKHLLIFKLGHEEYALDIVAVQEIRSYQVTTQINDDRPFIKGIVKLQDNVAIVIDMRMMFHITPATYNDFTLMIILNIKDHFFAMVVDEVTDVILLNTKDTHAAEDLANLMAKPYIKSILNTDNRLLILLDIEKLFSQELLQLVK